MVVKRSVFEILSFAPFQFARIGLIPARQMADVPGVEETLEGVEEHGDLCMDSEEDEDVKVCHSLF